MSAASDMEIWEQGWGGGTALSLSPHLYWASSPVLPGHFPCCVPRNPMPPENGLWSEKRLGMLFAGFPQGQMKWFLCIQQTPKDAQFPMYRECVC